MVLIDTLHVNRSGSKHLLNNLIHNLTNSKTNLYYLIDSRNESDFTMIPNSQKKILHANIFTRFIFYFFNKKKFTKIFCFSGIPPILKSKNVIYYNYFHNVILISNKSKNLIIYLKYLYIKIFKFNVNFWIVQNNYTSNLLTKNININKNNILILPFFSRYNKFKNIHINKFNFIYVSDAYEHKNHKRLFEAFFNLSKIYSEIKLTVTIDENKSEYIKLFNTYKNKGLNLINLGFNENTDIENLYKNYSCLIFPSLYESLGLGLVEASQLGLPIIASDLEYVHNAILTKYIFNPYSITSIETSVILYLKDKNVVVSELKLENHLHAIIDIIQQ